VEGDDMKVVIKIKIDAEIVVDDDNNDNEVVDNFDTIINTIIDDIKKRSR